MDPALQKLYKRLYETIEMNPKILVYFEYMRLKLISQNEQKFLFIPEGYISNHTVSFKIYLLTSVCTYISYYLASR